MVMNIYVGHKPFGLAVNQENDKIYVTNLNNYTLTMIDGRTNKILSHVIVGYDPRGVALNPFTNMIYVANAAF